MTQTGKNYQCLAVRQQGSVLNVTLNRPDLGNAMNRQMVDELQALLNTLQTDEKTDVLVINGAGKHFCSGGDINDMRQLRQQFADGESDAYITFNRAFGRLLQTLNHVPQVVIAHLHGATMGGGVGLACVADITLCDNSTVFALPETSLGIPPAQIAPFLVQRIGLTRVRQLALTGERFTAEQALELGLVHKISNGEQALQQELDSTLDSILRCAPKANSATKALLMAAAPEVSDELLDKAAQAFSDAMTGEEGREGTLAFAEKRPPAWHSRRSTATGEQNHV